MIDTVRIRQTRHMRDSAARRNWDIVTIRRETTHSDGFEDENIRSYSGTHKKTGIRFFGHRDQIVTVEASLPRVLFGHNGKLLRSQTDINAALRKLDRTLGKICHPPEGLPLFTRVDLVWHVPGDCGEFILAHRNVRHPRVRKATCIYEGESLTWRGAAFNLLLYDKTRKERWRAGDFVRVETQLRKHLLDELFGETGHLLDFPRCYEFFRGLVLQLQPERTPVVPNLSSLLAACARCRPPENELHPVDAYLQGLCSRRRRDLRRQMEAVRGATRTIDWTMLLPEIPPANPPELERAVITCPEE